MDFLWGRLRAFGFAFAGVCHLIRSQPNAWIHAAASVAVVIAGTCFRVAAWEWLWLIAAIGAVWAAEAINTALELIADAAVPERHVLIGRAKDVAAGAVLLTAAVAGVIAAVVFLPRLV